MTNRVLDLITGYGLSVINCLVRFFRTILRSLSSGCLSSDPCLPTSERLFQEWLICPFGHPKECPCLNSVQTERKAFIFDPWFWCSDFRRGVLTPQRFTWGHQDSTESLWTIFRTCRVQERWRGAQMVQIQPPSYSATFRRRRHLEALINFT